MHKHTSMEVSHAKVGNQERGQSNWKSKNQTRTNNMVQTIMANTGSNCIYKMGVGMPIDWMAIGPKQITSDRKLAQATPFCTSYTAIPRAQTKPQKGVLEFGFWIPCWTRGIAGRAPTAHEPKTLLQRMTKYAHYRVLSRNVCTPP